VSADTRHLVDPAPSALGGVGTVEDYLALLKPRVMSLVVFTALAGLVAAPGHIHPWLAGVALLAIAMGAGASGAINMWYDADIDAVMRRTAGRPLPAGRLLPGEALGFGLTLAVASVLLLGLVANWLAASLLAFTIFFYAVVYTMWLKRLTVQNIVIGGAAGALPPVIGWAVVTGSLAPAPLALFLVIFLWTPPHFWALALLRRDEYAAAGVPMLPVVRGDAETRRQILVYGAMLAVASFLPAVLGIAGPLYVTAAAVLGAVFLRLAWRLNRGGEPAVAGRLFGFSILYLFGLFAALLVEQVLALPVFPAVLS
jgi:protoheme IX farnesyltransferase